MPEQTSEEISALASSYLNFQGGHLLENIGIALMDEARIYTQTGQLKEYCSALAKDIRSLAASCLSQDETSAKD